MMDSIPTLQSMAGIVGEQILNLIDEHGAYGKVGVKWNGEYELPSEVLRFVYPNTCYTAIDRFDLCKSVMDRVYDILKHEVAVVNRGVVGITYGDIYRHWLKVCVALSLLRSGGEDTLVSYVTSSKLAVDDVFYAEWVNVVTELITKQYDEVVCEHHRSLERNATKYTNVLNNVMEYLKE